MNKSNIVSNETLIEFLQEQQGVTVNFEGEKDKPHPSCYAIVKLKGLLADLTGLSATQLHEFGVLNSHNDHTDSDTTIYKLRAPVGYLNS